MWGGLYIPSNIDKILATKNSAELPPGDWERRAEAEIYEIKKYLRRSSLDLTMPIGLALCVTSPFIVIGILDNFDLEMIVVALKISLPLLVITLLCQVVSGRSFVKRPKIEICNKCHKENDLNLKKCHCGGLYEPPEFYVYVERDAIKDN